MASETDSPRPLTSGDIDALRTDIQGLRAEAKSVRRFGWHNRIGIAVSLVALAIDIPLTLIIRGNADRIQHQQREESCWNHVLAEATINNNGSPATQNKILLDAKRCVALYEGKRLTH